MSSGDRLSRLDEDFNKIAVDYAQNREDYKRNKGWKAGLLNILRGVIAVVEDAQKDGQQPPDVLGEAEKALNKVLTFAYSCNHNGDPLFDNMDAFCDSTERPLLQFKRPEGVSSHRDYKMAASFFEHMRKIGYGDRQLPIKPPGPWKDVARPHALSTQCARFKDEIPEVSPEDDKPLAQSVFQSRAEVSIMATEVPGAIYSSTSAKCVILPTSGGYKNRSPYLSVFVNDDKQPKNYIDGRNMRLGLADIAYHGAVDEDSGLFFVGDEERIKSYSWWHAEKNAQQDPPIPTHTMNSNGFHRGIGLLPNGRVARAGTGKIAIWNLDDLPSHQLAKDRSNRSNQGALIGKSIAGEDGELDTWRDDPEEVEMSSGSRPSSIIKLADKSLTINRWHPHPTSPGTMLVSTDREKSDQFYCRALNLESAGECTARYLGHGGEINQFSTSKGDPNVFVTACNDGYARLYDTRQPLPQITIRAGDNGQNCSGAVLCHPDGVPYIFLAEEEAQCVTLWDVRAKAPIYDLATGNNNVTGIVWNDERNELYASTYCQYMDRFGNHFGYEPARIPRDEDDHKDDDEVEGSDEEWEYDTDQAWPKKAFHGETNFGHIFDSGEHRIYRYAFKTDPDLTILPPDGQVTVDDERDYW